MDNVKRALIRFKQELHSKTYSTHLCTMEKNVDDLLYLIETLTNIVDLLINEVSQNG